MGVTVGIRRILVIMRGIRMGLLRSRMRVGTMIMMMTSVLVMVEEMVELRVHSTHTEYNKYET
jgi:hypothetical protein